MISPVDVVISNPVTPPLVFLSKLPSVVTSVPSGSVTFSSNSA